MTTRSYTLDKQSEENDTVVFTLQEFRHPFLFPCLSGVFGCDTVKLSGAY